VFSFLLLEKFTVTEEMKDALQVQTESEERCAAPEKGCYV
jgi:hypothetical protein